MKALIIPTFIFILVYMLSCKPSDIDDPANKLCSVDSIDFSYTKDASLIVVNTKLAWTITTNASWVKFTESSSIGKKGILIGLEENVGFPRNAIAIIKSGKNVQTIKLIQSGAPRIEVSVNAQKINIIKVNGGTFTMGDTQLNTPQHEVKLSEFYICETEVTNAFWLAVAGTLPYDNLSHYAGHNEQQKPNHPVTAVTWNDIKNIFLPALKTKTNIEFRLPTEAEWEFAAMGGTSSNGYLYAGSDFLADVGWNELNSSGEKKQVMQKDPNELGLYDMSGNASEWVSDWHESNYSVSVLKINPKGPETGVYKVVRGGSYASPQASFAYDECKVKQRYRLKPTGYEGAAGNNDDPLRFVCDPVGFRFVISF